MDLILWRHAEAEPGEPDLGRRLTAKGLRHAEQMGAWLEGHLPDAARILVSPAARAQQTARALNRRSRVVAEIGPGASVVALLAAVGWPDSRVPVVVIGHQPTLGGVASFLLCGEESSWAIKKASLWWLSNRLRDGGGGVALRAAMGPDMLCRSSRPGALPQRPSTAVRIALEPRAS